LASSRLLSWTLVAALLLSGCDRRRSKPDPTMGAVAGIVICSDTGKPARFATVNLTPVPVKHAEPHEDPPLAPVATIDTGLDGKFRMEAIPAGEYYAFANLDGYLDPQRGIDFGKITAKQTTIEQEKDAVQQWRNQLVEVKVAVRRVSEIVIEIHRAAAIEGTVSYDDGSPAIGMHFHLFRKDDNKKWSAVGLPLFGSWSIDSVSDRHGHYAVDDLAAGEYIVCAMMPIESEDVAPQVCLGNVFRRKSATTVKVGDGETARGEDIVIPLSGMHSVEGRVEAAQDGLPPSHATVTLLFADDHEEARKISIDKDGGFLFEYVPEDNYILRVSDAADDVQDNAATPSEEKPALSRVGRKFLDKDIPLIVQSDMSGIDISLMNAASKPL